MISNPGYMLVNDSQLVHGHKLVEAYQAGKLVINPVTRVMRLVTNHFMASTDHFTLGSTPQAAHDPKKSRGISNSTRFQRHGKADHS